MKVPGEFLAYLFLRSLKSFLYRMYGERTLTIRGKLPDSKILLANEIADLGCGLSRYSFELAALSRREGFEGKLYLIDLSSEILNFHKALVEGKDISANGFEEWKNWILNGIRKYGVSLDELEVEVIQADIFKDNLPKAELGICSYVLNYYPAEFVVSALSELTELYDRFLAIKLQDENKINWRNFPRKRVWVCGKERIDLTKTLKSDVSIFLALGEDLRWYNLNLYIAS